MGYARVDSEVARICEQAVMRFSEAGATVEQIELDWDDPHPCWNVLFYGSATSRLGEVLDKKGHLLDPGLRNAVGEGLKLRGLDITSALTEQHEFWQRVRRVYDQCDVLVTPTLAVPPFPIGQDNADPLPGQQPRELQWTQFSYPFNLTGQPAVSVPGGWTAAGLPVGLQIVGRRFDDVTVLRVARAWEQIQPWCHLRPELQI